jgi:hypothetical protein
MYDIRTPNGSTVMTMLCNESLSQAERVAMDDGFWSEYYDEDLELIPTYGDGSSSTTKFQCHGYAWIRVDYGVDRWIEPGFYSDLGKFISDDSYVRVDSETFPAKISWTNTDHSGITTPESGLVISKWLIGPLCRHRWDNSPYGTPDSPPSLIYYVRNCDNTGTLIINLENQTITTNQTHTACSINVKNVKVSNNSKLILDAENEFNIIGEFEVELGSELEIW